MDKKQRVLCAMSGGVDSSVAAQLLMEQGYEVVGVTMVLRTERVLSESCCNEELVEASPEAFDARKVCQKLGIQHVVMDYRKTFAAKVMHPFCDSYIQGLTPNPCIECNKHLKFGVLFELREQLKCDYLATGHYAQVAFNKDTDKYELQKGKDVSKDQSYVLYHISQKELAHILFPLGSLTKAQVREIANGAGFANANKPESQDICFVSDGNYARFIETYDSFIPEPGPIIDMQGNVLGQHKGLLYYTIGQRKGLGVAVGEPLFVIEKQTATNSLVVGRSSDTGIREICANDVSLPSDDDLSKPISVEVKINYRAKLCNAIAWMENKNLYISFDKPLRAAAPGQAVVAYCGNRVVAGGTITSYR